MQNDSMMSSKPFCGIYQDCCGNCMHILPSQAAREGKQPKVIRSGAGKGKLGYWECSCEESEYFGKPRVDEDRPCPKFDSRYSDSVKAGEWRKKCYNEDDTEGIKIVKVKRPHRHYVRPRRQ